MKKLRKPVGAAILSLFVATGVAFLSQPIILTHAETATSDVNLNIGAVMSLSLDADSLDLSTTPHHFVSGTINATVSTNSQYGYTLTLEDVDSNTDLAHTNTAVSDSFSSDFSGSKTSSEMEDNTWGFSLNATDYFKVPANGSPVALKRTTDPMTTANETIPVTFGAQVGNIMSGTYDDSVLFTMYVNGQDGKPTNPDDPDNPPVDPSDPGDPDEEAATMQGFQCELKNIGDTATLVDSRDGSRYRIERLADGNCWMLDNLRIAGKTLTSEDSNVLENVTFNLPASDINSFDGLPSYTAAVYVDPTYGGFYNYYTATAGFDGYSMIYTGVNYAEYSAMDLCPKGWHMPTGGPGGNVKTLVDTYGSDTLAAQKLDLKLSGYVTNYFDKGMYMITDSSNSSYSHFWTSRSMNAYNAYEYYAMTYQDSIFYSWEYWSTKTFGESIRCIAQ